MRKLKNIETGFSAVEALLILVIIGLLGFTGWYVWHAKQSADKTLTADNSTVPSFKKKNSTGAPNPYAGWKSYSSTVGGYSFKYPSNWVIATENANNKNFNVVSGDTSGLNSFELLYANPSSATNNFGLSFGVLPGVTTYGAVPAGATSTTRNLSNGLYANVIQYSRTQPPTTNIYLYTNSAGQSSIKLADGKYLTVNGGFLGGEGQDAQGSIAYKTTLALPAQLLSQQYNQALSILQTVKL